MLFSTIPHQPTITANNRARILVDTSEDGDALQRLGFKTSSPRTIDDGDTALCAVMAGICSKAESQSLRRKPTVWEKSTP